MRYINFLHTNKTTKQNYLKWTISDLKPLSVKTYFGSRLPQLLHVFSLNTSRKFHKFSKISERDSKSSLQVAAHFISLFARLFLLRTPQSQGTPESEKLTTYKTKAEFSLLFFLNLYPIHTN